MLKLRVHRDPTKASLRQADNSAHRTTHHDPLPECYEGVPSCSQNDVMEIEPLQPGGHRHAEATRTSRPGQSQPRQTVSTVRRTTQHDTRGERHEGASRHPRRTTWFRSNPSSLVLILILMLTLYEHQKTKASFVKLAVRRAEPLSMTLVMFVMKAFRCVRGTMSSRYSPISLPVTLILGTCGRQNPIKAIMLITLHAELQRSPSSLDDSQAFRAHNFAPREQPSPPPPPLPRLKTKRALHQAGTGLANIL